MELCVVDGRACIKRTVNNVEVFNKLKSANIKGISPIIKIDGYTVYYQYINGLSLREFCEKNLVESKLNLTRFIFDIVKILECLKEIDVVHKDLKPENIIISYDMNVYLIDFDVSRVSIQKEQDTSLFGTRGYASPEHFGYKSTSFKSDMYSLGVIIKEIDYKYRYLHISNKCTEVDAINRYNNYNELIDDLDRFEIVKPLIHSLNHQPTYINDVGLSKYSRVLESRLEEYLKNIIDNLKEYLIYLTTRNKKKEIKDDKEKSSLKGYFLSSYSKKTAIIFMFLFLSVTIMSVDKKKFSFTDLYYSMFFAYLVVDFIDNIRVFIFKREFLKYKIATSFIIIISSIFLYSLIESIYSFFI